MLGGWAQSRSVLVLWLSPALPVSAGSGRLPPWACPRPQHVLRHRQEPCLVTWRSCALCSRSRPGRWCPRSPSCCRSSSSSCGASSHHLQTLTRTGHGRRRNRNSARTEPLTSGDSTHGPRLPGAKQPSVTAPQCSLSIHLRRFWLP